jgi:hypothetical protein
MTAVIIKMITMSEIRPRRSRVLTIATTISVMAKITPRLLLPETLMLGLTGCRLPAAVGSSSAERPEAAPSAGVSGKWRPSGATITSRAPGNWWSGWEIVAPATATVPSGTTAI